MPDEDINILEKDEEFDIFNKKREYILNYSQNAKKDWTFAGDIEIATTCILFNCNIKMYLWENAGFRVIYNYNMSENNSNIVNDNIDILFINNNHFNLLIPKKNSNINKKSLIEQKIEIKEMENILINKIKNT